MAGIMTASPVGAMVDPTKGSFTNRAECAKEHFKNNLSYNLQLSAAGAGATIVAIKKPKPVITLATKVGEVAAKLFSKLGGKGVAAKIMKNPTKFGAVGLAVAGGLWVLNKLTNHAFKAGQIDQKYTDSAAIEEQGKRFIIG